MKKARYAVLALLLLLSLTLVPLTPANASIEVELFSAKSASASISASGKSVSYGGSGKFSTIESEASIYVYLQEQRNGAWYTIASVSKSDEDVSSVSKSGSKTVTGGYNYRAYAVASNGSTTATDYSDTKWIAK